jgi:site-specific recombinase XerD
MTVRTHPTHPTQGERPTTERTQTTATRVNPTVTIFTPLHPQHTIDEQPAPGQGPAADQDGGAAPHHGEPVMHDTPTLVDHFTTWLAAAGLAAPTLRVRRRHLLDLATVHPDLLAVTTHDLATWLAHHAWGHSARQQARATLRVFYGWLVDEGALPASPAARLPRVRHPRPKSRPAPVGVIAAALLRAGERERRMILAARYLGLRRGEVTRIHARDLTTLPDGAPALLVRGKGDHARTVPLHPQVAGFLEGLDGWLFPGRAATGHMDPDTVGRYVSTLLGPGWTMHSLRHRAANDWLAVTGDIRAVQELLGHASLSTTQIYLDARQDAMTAAVLGVA